MWNLLLILAAATLRLPNVETFEDYQWQPAFTKPEDLKLESQTVAFLTHASRHFDPLCITQPAVIRATQRMKEARNPVVYLHDRYNSKNPAWMYLYRDRQPSAFISSDVGHFDLDFSNVRHVISLGGYFGQCQRSTVEDSIRCWSRDGSDHDFRVTQVVDGIFCVSEFMRTGDPYGKRVREYFYDYLRSLHPKAVISVFHTLRCIEDRDLRIDYLCRQLPAVPSNVNVVLDFFGHTETVQVSRSADAPTLTFAWRESDSFLDFQKPSVNRKNVVRRSLRRGRAVPLRR